MKKFASYLLIIPSLILSGCAIPDISSEKKEESSIREEVPHELIFSELYIGERYSDRAVEIANIGENTLDLSKYYINIFRDGGGEKALPSETIHLEGTLESNHTFVIAYPSAKQEILDKADMISADFLNDGTFPMTINDINGDVIDSIGYPGYFYDVANHADTVRKVEKLSPSTYSAYDYVRYPTSCLDNLGNLDCVDNDTLFKGPKLTAQDFNTPYTSDGVTGDGGAVEVTLSYTIDGDTTRFIFPNSLSQYDLNGNKSVRYYGINTPEIAHGGNPADPYGPEAREFTNNLINSSKHFVVQSVKGYSLTETYGRMLGYIWVSDKNNPDPEDYYLLNHYIVQNGYARIGHIDRGGYNDYMLYNGISFVEYLYDAQQYAIANKLHIYEEGL